MKYMIYVIFGNTVSNTPEKTSHIRCPRLEKSYKLSWTAKFVGKVDSLVSQVFTYFHMFS